MRLQDGAVFQAGAIAPLDYQGHVGEFRRQPVGDHPARRGLWRRHNVHASRQLHFVEVQHVQPPRHVDDRAAVFAVLPDQSALPESAGHLGCSALDLLRLSLFGRKDTADYEFPGFRLQAAQQAVPVPDSRNGHGAEQKIGASVVLVAVDFPVRIDEIPLVRAAVWVDLRDQQAFGRTCGIILYYTRLLCII